MGEDYNEETLKQIAKKGKIKEGHCAAVFYVTYGKEILNKFNVAVQKGGDALKNAVQNFVNTENEKLSTADTQIRNAIKTKKG